jgi:hypothetical protein
MVIVEPDVHALLKKHVAVQDPCEAADGFDDIHAGTQVVIADETGATVALGDLNGGNLQGTEGDPVFTLDCGFDFIVPDIPVGHPFYKVSIGRRGTQEYTAAQLREPIELTLS